MRAVLLQPIGADCGGKRVALGSEIGVQEYVREGPHRQVRLGKVVPNLRTAVMTHDGGCQGVRLAAQGVELRSRRGQVWRLVEPDAVAYQDLVGTDHECSWIAGRYLGSLEVGQCKRRVRCAAAVATGGLLDCGFIEVCRH